MVQYLCNTRKVKYMCPTPPILIGRGCNKAKVVVVRMSANRQNRFPLKVYFFHLLRPPQAVDVAIRASYYFLGRFPSTWLPSINLRASRISKQRFGFVAGFQEFPAGLAVNDNFNPLEIMSCFHGMRNSLKCSRLRLQHFHPG